MHPVRYTQLHAEYHFWRSVDVAERTAAMFDRFLVPSRLLHWQRKSKFAERRVQISKKTYYAISRDEMTTREYKSYLDEVRRVEEESEALELCHA